MLTPEQLRQLDTDQLRAEFERAAVAVYGNPNTYKAALARDFGYDAHAVSRWMHKRRPPIEMILALYLMQLRPKLTELRSLLSDDTP